MRDAIIAICLCLTIVGGCVLCNRQDNEMMIECLKAGRAPAECR